MPQLETIVSISIGVLVILLVIRSRSRNLLPLPPGPKGLPLVGNLLDIPSSYAWETYHKWSTELGKLHSASGIAPKTKSSIGSDIIHLNVAGQSIIVLDTFEVTNELLEKRSSIYSSR